MINPPKQSGPNDEPDLYRKHTMQDANTMDTERTSGSKSTRGCPQGNEIGNIKIGRKTTTPHT